MPGGDIRADAKRGHSDILHNHGIEPVFVPLQIDEVRKAGVVGVKHRSADVEIQILIGAVVCGKEPPITGGQVSTRAGAAKFTSTSTAIGLPVPTHHID